MVPELLTSAKILLLHLGPPSLLPVPTGLHLTCTIPQFYIHFLSLHTLQASAMYHPPPLQPLPCPPPPSTTPSLLPLSSPRLQKMCPACQVGEWTLCNPPHHHFQCHGWQLLLNLFLHFTLSQCNDLWAGERARGDGGNNRHSTDW